VVTPVAVPALLLASPAPPSTEPPLPPPPQPARAVRAAPIAPREKTRLLIRNFQM
jgi:hypothetical protein